MYPKRNVGRSLLGLMLAFGIAATLVIFNILVAFSARVYEYFEAYSKYPLSRWLLHALFIWLAFLLVLAFRQWRQANQQSQELDAVLSSISPDALVVVAPDRKIRMCNDSVRRIFGRSPDEVIGKTTEILYFDRRTDPTKPREIYEALERDGFHHGLATGKRKDGSTVPLEIIAADLIGRGGAVLLIRDITERLAMEEDRRRLEENAQQMHRIESLGMLAGGVAHDFNNILMVIQGHADLTITLGGVTPTTAASIAEIQRGVDRGRDLCRKLMSFAGRGLVEMVPLDLNVIVRESLRLMSVGLGTRIQLTDDVAENIPLVRGDSTQMHQVVMNLMSNAIEAIGDRDGQILVQTGAREFSAEDLKDCRGQATPEAGKYVYIRITDDGCGMDEATVKRICEPLFTTKAKGHGMGMAVVLGIIRRHRGYLCVTSVPGKGTTFSVLLPEAEAGGLLV